MPVSFRPMWSRRTGAPQLSSFPGTCIGQALVTPASASLAKLHPKAAKGPEADSWRLLPRGRPASTVAGDRSQKTHLLGLGRLLAGLPGKRQVSIDIRRAEHSDAPALVTIINQAFQVERFFIESDRIALDEVLELLGKGEFLIADDAGCVYVEPRNDRCYLGLLSVSRARRRSWQKAHECCRGPGARTTLPVHGYPSRQPARGTPPFYRRMGYVETGTSEFTPGVETLLPCHFLHMSKALA